MTNTPETPKPTIPDTPETSKPKIRGIHYALICQPSYGVISEFQKKEHGYLFLRDYNGEHQETQRFKAGIAALDDLLTDDILVTLSSLKSASVESFDKSLVNFVSLATDVLHQYARSRRVDPHLMDEYRQRCSHPPGAVPEVIIDAIRHGLTMKEKGFNGGCRGRIDHNLVVCNEYAPLSELKEEMSVGLRTYIPWMKIYVGSTEHVHKMLGQLIDEGSAKFTPETSDCYLIKANFAGWAGWNTRTKKLN